MSNNKISILTNHSKKITSVLSLSLLALVIFSAMTLPADATSDNYEILWTDQFGSSDNDIIYTSSI